jgi:hypothetical protein
MKRTTTVVTRLALLVSVLGLVASIAFGGSGPVPDGEVEAMIAVYRERSLDNESVVMKLSDNSADYSGEVQWLDIFGPYRGEEAQECFKFSVVDPALLAKSGSWLAMGLAAEDAVAKTGGNGKPAAHEGMSTAEISNKLNNPGSSLAQLNFKFNWSRYKGDLPGSRSQDSLSMDFQPVLPFKLSDGGNFILRPTIPLVWQPNFDAGKGGFDENFGLGDSQIDAFYSRTDAKRGFMWGAGGVAQFPTHTDSALGKDQYQAGPAAFAGMMGKWGSAGLFPQHLWNIGGNGEGYTATTVVQPWYWFSMGDGWQVGGSPSIVYDWAHDDSDQAWTVPVNLGLAKTIMVGKMPVKIKLEVIYYIQQPDAFGPAWGLQLTITPVVKNVFAGLFK